MRDLQEMSKEYKEYEDAKRRVLEAKRLIKLIEPRELKQSDARFYFQVERKLKSDFCEIDNKTIYWLRDIKDRQLEG